MAGTARKVIQCDTSGKEIRCFDSSRQAALSFGSIWPSSIHRSIKYGVTAFGFRWKYVGDELIKKARGTPGSKRKVIAIAGDIALPFESLSKASRILGIKLSTIEHAILTGDKVKGYRFYYQDIGPGLMEKKGRSKKPVVAVDNCGKPIKEWSSVIAAAFSLEVVPSAVYWCLNKKHPNAKCKGYRFRYKEDLFEGRRIKDKIE